MRTAARQLAGERCSSCLDIHLGDYNVFLLGDYSGVGDIGGKVAAGGNLTMSHFSVGAELPADNVSNVLVAGGTLDIKSGVLPPHGTAWYGSSYLQEGLSCEPDCLVSRGTPIDFAARFAELRGLSSRLAAQKSNGTTRFEYGVMLMSGADPCLNVFEANASDLGGLWKWEFQVPAGSVVVLNLHGTSITLPYNFGGVDSSNSRRVLYNFVDATHLTANGVFSEGTVLAPYAHVDFQNGGWSGGIYAVSLSKTGFSLHDNPLEEMPKATEETCNGKDDNCDGQVDDGFECTGSGTESCTAWCGAAGTRACDPATCGYGECTSSSCCRADTDCAAGSYCEGTTCATLKENGAECSSAGSCASGQCVDGVCCDTACAGACDACNLAGHGGTCSMVPSTVQCRASSGGECDLPESCTGSDAACPDDHFKDSSEACTDDGNACTTDLCDGTGGCRHSRVLPGTSCGSGLICNEAAACVNECRIDGTNYVAGFTNKDAECLVCDPSLSTSNWSLAPSTKLCRNKADVCDAEEYCTGSSSVCPSDTYASSSKICGDSGDGCEVPARCSGSGPSCPGNSPRSSDSTCADEGNVCTDDMCDGSGSCSHRPVPGRSCGSGLVCNSAGGCVAAARCPSMTKQWNQWQPKWYGNDKTEGEYVCAASLPGSPSGTSVQVSPNSQARTGTAQFTCDNGEWTPQPGSSCDGALVDTRVYMVCSTTDVVLSGWVARYTSFLKRCADRDGLHWWATQDVTTLGCTEYDTPAYKNYASEKACWDGESQKAANKNGNAYTQAQACNHISDWDENYLCPPGTTYPWTGFETFPNGQTKCKYKHHDNTLPCP